jgi:adenylosuccinate lyase
MPGSRVRVPPFPPFHSSLTRAAVNSRPRRTDIELKLSVQFVAQQLAARLFATMVQEHERAAGAWHAEWIVLPELCNLAHSALHATVQLMDGLQVNVARMQENLTLTAGLIFAAPFANLLAPQLGRERAHSLVCGPVSPRGRRTAPVAGRRRA